MVRSVRSVRNPARVSCMWIRIRSPGLMSRSWPRFGLTALRFGLVERAGEQRVRRSLGMPASGDVGPVDGLGAAEDVVVAGAGVLCARGVLCAPVLVQRAAVDRHRRAVLVRGAAESFELRHVTRTVELKLHERVARVLADVVRRGGIGAHQVVAVGIRRAFLGVLGSGLGVAQRKAEPEGRPQLEVPRRAALTRGVRLLLRVPGQRHRVGHVVARPRAAGLEQHRRLVVPDVLTPESAGNIDARGSAALAERLVVALGAVARRPGR